jgi:hypothetical protein
MRGNMAALSGAVLTGFVLASCSTSKPSPTAPSATDGKAQALQANAVVATQSQIHTDTHGHKLTAVVGHGAGIVNVTPTREDHGTFDAEIEVDVHDALPNTTFAVKRAVDFTVNGVCTGSFVQIPLPNPGPLVTLTTSAGGAGAVHVGHFERPIASGTQFDVMFQVIAPGTELRTECFTVTVK